MSNDFLKFSSSELKQKKKEMQDNEKGRSDSQKKAEMQDNEQKPAFCRLKKNE